MTKSNISYLHVKPATTPGISRETKTPENFISIENFSLKINLQTIFSNLTFPIYQNQLNTLIGPSGCGKSSLLNSIIRLSDYIPGVEYEGNITIDGNSIFHQKTNLVQLRKKVAMIFQKPMPFPMSIVKNFEVPLKEHGIKHKSMIAEKIETSLRQVGLWNEVKDRLHRNALILSGGQQQRLCIARALALEPKALLLDEPCSALDPISVQIIEELLNELKQQYTILIVTHNIAQAKRLADYVSFMWYSDNKGVLVEHNRADILFKNTINPLTKAYVQGVTE